MWDKIKKIFGGETEPTPSIVDPKKQIADLIVAERQKVHAAGQTMTECEANTRSLNSEFVETQQDIDRIQERLKHVTSEAEKMTLESKLSDKNKIIANNKQRLEESNVAYQQAKRIVDNYDDSLRQIQRQADSLNIQVDVSQADKDMEAFKTNLSTGNGGVGEALGALNQQVQKNKAQTTVSKGLRAEDDYSEYK